MQLRVIIQRAANVFSQPLFHCPGEHVAQRVEIEMQVERDVVIEAETLIVNLSTVHETTTERDDLALLSPDEKSHTVGHLLAQAAKIILRQMLKLHGRALVDLQIKRINF